MDLSIVIPAYQEGKNIGILIKKIKEVLKDKNILYEIIVVDNHSSDETPQEVIRNGGILINQEERGYGGALKAGFNLAQGKYVLTMDADFSHPPTFILNFYQKRKLAEMIIGSRYIKGGKAEMSLFRKFLSLMLNKSFAYLLGLPFKDLSSGFRLYRKSALDTLHLKSQDFDILEEILILIYCQGLKIIEVPIHYLPRRSGKTHAKLMRFVISYLKTFYRMWRLKRATFSRF
jgi:dolichol-phosphate mannosyltransferase